MTTTRAFTLIELLVVVAIMAILAGLTVSAASMMRQAARRTTTQAIMSVVTQALRIHGAERGGTVDPAEHPLAGSAEPRFIFRRPISPFAAVAANGMALGGVLETNLPAGDRSRLLLPNDVCGDDTLPMFYGAQRQHLGVLAPAMSGVTAYRVYPPPLSTTWIMASPDLSGRIVTASGSPAETRSLLQGLFTRTEIMDELDRLRALYTPGDDLPAHLVANGRVWSTDLAGASVPVSHTARVLDAGTWHHYRLRGLTLVDAWGNEILYSLSNGGRSAHLISAGKDGHLVWDPGTNLAFDTDPWETAPYGDDRRADRDNVMVGADP